MGSDCISSWSLLIFLLYFKRSVGLYWQGVGGKLSRAVYLAPHLEFQREWIICKFYYTIYYRNICWKRYKHYFSQSEILTSNVQLGYVLTRGGGQAVQGGLSCPPPRISVRLDNPQILLHHLLQEYLVERDINIISINLRCSLQRFSWVMYWQGVGDKLSRVVYLAPLPRISERIDNPQILLHHLLQEYLVERDINVISINLRCSLQRFSWVTYWQGVGGKLSRAVYLAPRPEFQRELIIPKFYYTICYRNI